MINRIIIRYSHVTIIDMRMEAADKEIGSGIQCVLDTVFVSI